jgi:hypothetical protein
LKAAERNIPATSALPLFANVVEAEPDARQEVLVELEALDPDCMSPREALEALYALRQRLSGTGESGEVS